VAILALCWLAAVATPAGAVMPSPTGTVPPEIVQGFADGLFQLPARSGRLTTSAVQSVWNVPIVMVTFSDQPLSTTIYGGATAGQFFERRLFDTTGTTPTGSVFDYYRWVSGDRIRVVGKVVATVALPNPKTYYANNNWGLGFNPPQNIYGVVTAALQTADSSVDWRSYDQDRDGYVDVVWVMHSGPPGESGLGRDNLWSLNSRLSAWPSGEKFSTHTPVPGAPGLRMKIDGFSMLPEISASRPGLPAEIGVFCHEFGHTLGLPDLYDTSTSGGGTNAGSGNWNLMATGGYGTDGGSPEYPAHLGAWSLLFLGWRQSIRPATDTVLVQAPLAQGGPVVEFWFQGESNPEHFLIENRQREGFDRNIPEEGLLLYQINETAMTLGLQANRVNSGVVPGLRIVEADGLYDIVAGRNRGEKRDPFPGFLGRTEIDDDTSPSTRSYGGSVTNIALHEINPVGDAVRYRLQVRAPGWESTVRATTGDYNPIWPSSAANRAVMFADGSLAMVTNEPRAGRAQVMLRTRPPEGAWGDPTQVSESAATATDPTIAALPGGDDLVLVWSDSRHGAGELYYRSRLGGVWTRERRLTDLAGDSRYPSVAVDRFGRVHLAWLYTQAASPQVRFMSFTYFSPYGTPLTVTDPTDLPDAPVVVAGPDGSSNILWSDRATSSAKVWIVGYSPTAGLSAKQQLARSGSAQPAVDAAVDLTGVVHVVWQESGAGLNEIHYQRRSPGAGTPSPFDTVIVSRRESVQNPALRADPAGGLHLAFIANNGGVQQVHYKRWQPNGGWDYTSTEVTLVSDGPMARPAVVPASADEVSVLYLGFPGGVTQQLERRRGLPASTVAAPQPIRAVPALAFRLGPNPLRAGAPLVLQATISPGSPAPVVDLFDLTGRRVASVPLVPRGDGAFAEVPGEATSGWHGGVYFAHLRGRGLRAARLVVIR
jgi:M6 family metalloprotease-like protein